MRSDFLQREASLVFYIISCGRVLGLYTHNNIVHNILYSYICNIATIYLKYNIVYRDLQAHRQSRLSCGRVGIARPSHRPLSIYRGASICIYYVINAHNNTRLGIKERKNEFFIIPYFPVCCLYPFCVYIDRYIYYFRFRFRSTRWYTPLESPALFQNDGLLYLPHIVIIFYYYYNNIQAVSCAFATNYYFYELTETTTCDGGDGTQYYIQFIIICFSGHNCAGNSMQQLCIIYIVGRLYYYYYYKRLAVHRYYPTPVSYKCACAETGDRSKYLKKTIYFVENISVNTTLE